MNPLTIKHFFDENTFTLTYVVYDQITKDALIIDPVLDYDSASSSYFTKSVQEVISFVNNHNLLPHYIFETHAHADHITGAQELKKIFPKAQNAIGEHITDVQNVFKNIFNFECFATSGGQFDKLLKDDEIIHAGSIKIKVLHTPGHTPACVSLYINEEIVFTGDALFMPDYGTGRCDFPSGSADKLYDSISKKLYSLPNNTKVYVGHDYLPNGRQMAFESTIGEEKLTNIQLKDQTSQNDFVTFRNNRDKGLKAPKLLLPSIHININAGVMPPKEENGISYLKIPIRERQLT